MERMHKSDIEIGVLLRLESIEEEQLEWGGIEINVVLTQA